MIFDCVQKDTKKRQERETERGEADTEKEKKEVVTKESVKSEELNFYF